MAVLIIDDFLPSSIFSGKSVRLINVYSRLANSADLYLLRTRAKDYPEAPEMRAWADKTFKEQFYLEPLKPAAFARKLSALLRLKPWFDLQTKYPEQAQIIREYILQIIDRYSISAVLTSSLESAPFGELVMDKVSWFQDLGDSMDLQLKRRIEKTSSVKEKLVLSLRKIREGKYERSMIETANKSFFVAADDAGIFPPEKVVIVPNGVDSEYFSPDACGQLDAKSDFVVFTGHMSFPPNIDCVVYFAKQVLPILQESRRDLGFKIVGADPTPEVMELSAIDGVEVTGRVADLRPYLKEALAFVCPMRMGSGIKNKILEAMSMDLKIIASAMALKGLSKKPEELEETSVEPRVFANEVLRQIESSKPTQGYSPRTFVKEHYSWDLAAQKYCEELKLC